MCYAREFDVFEMAMIRPSPRVVPPAPFSLPGLCTPASLRAAACGPPGALRPYDARRRPLHRDNQPIAPTSKAAAFNLGAAGKRSTHRTAGPPARLEGDLALPLQST